MLGTTPDAVAALEAALATTGLRAIARVIESHRAIDFALALSPVYLAAIRCVDSAAVEDHTALATMRTEGDFVWAGLVYSEGEGSGLSGLIESFHIGEADRLVARLLELREAWGEAD